MAMAKADSECAVGGGRDFRHPQIAEPMVAVGQLPDFLLIGAAQSTSTSLMSHLRQHPQIFMPKARTGFSVVEGEPIYPFGSAGISPPG